MFLTDVFFIPSEKYCSLEFKCKKTPVIFFSLSYGYLEVAICHFGIINAQYFCVRIAPLSGGLYRAKLK